MHLNLVLGASADAEPDEQELRRLAPRRAGPDPSVLAAQPAQERGAVRLRRPAGDRPQTLAYALTDSPIGHLAWIAEKFKEWTDSQNGPEDAVDRDQLLTNVMLYWLTGTAGSAARIYYKRAHADYAGPATCGIERADCGRRFPAENFITLRHLAERTNNIVRWTSFDRGGHFAAMEQPQLLVDDIRVFSANSDHARPSGLRRGGGLAVREPLRQPGLGGRPVVVGHRALHRVPPAAVAADPVLAQHCLAGRAQPLDGRLGALVVDVTVGPATCGRSRSRCSISGLAWCRGAPPSLSTSRRSRPTPHDTVDLSAERAAHPGRRAHPAGDTGHTAARRSCAAATTSPTVPTR